MLAVMEALRELGGFVILVILILASLGIAHVVEVVHLRFKRTKR